MSAAARRQCVGGIFTSPPGLETAIGIYTQYTNVAHLHQKSNEQYVSGGISKDRVENTRARNHVGRNANAKHHIYVWGIKLCRVVYVIC